MLGPGSASSFDTNCFMPSAFIPESGLQVYVSHGFWASLHWLLPGLWPVFLGRRCLGCSSCRKGAVSPEKYLSLGRAQRSHPAIRSLSCVCVGERVLEEKKKAGKLLLVFWLCRVNVEVPGPGIEPVLQQQPRLQQ